ncbi:hypothetical protein IQ254_17500 [Nodosilinea sp. LEGE 07088]|uniref:hypothetical protein n=1 Tax=Nodosilinea sp. LEGE 07088 TaxID=2777968 RepID=UPI00187E20E5|nr:hypothetical protein [Nodosilinea sp. LEGE 07088]MBE9138965.1 hypothetical protein [Nodosilinea sp. LEGE 07088]
MGFTLLWCRYQARLQAVAVWHGQINLIGEVPWLSNALAYGYGPVTCGGCNGHKQTKATVEDLSLNRPGMVNMRGLLLMAGLHPP